MIYDNSGNYLNGHNPDSISIDETRSDFGAKPQIKEGFLEKSSTIKFSDQSYGTVVVGASLSPIRANVRSTFWLLLFTGIGCVLASVLISMVFSSRIVNPLTAVQKAMEALSNRDLTQHCTVKTVDETAVMADSVNTAIDSLRQSLSVTSDGAERISKAVTMLSSVSQIMADNSGTMADKSQVVSESIAAALNRTENMKNASDEVTNSIQTVAASIEEMNSSLNEVAKNCSKESSIVESASKKANDAQSVMQELGSAAKEITSINDVIDDIAQQTNLLALNATIEAASAGDAGKGFAVVANEIKILANQTAKATSEIAEKIQSIQERSDNAVTVIADIAKVVEEIDSISHSIVAAVEQQSSTVSGIAEIGGKTSASAERISSDVAQWAEEMNQIASGFQTVDQAASATTKGADDIEHSVKELEKLSSELTQIVEKFHL
ncbi:MAG: methyl-accepting chemotaxis protein [Chitinivibrionales bacterium]